MGDFAATTDSKGHFAFTVQQTGLYLGKNSAKATIELSVKAPGYSNWTITGAHYLKSDVLRLYPKLARTGHGDVAVAAAQPAAGPVGGDMSSSAGQGAGKQNAPFAAGKPASPAPPAIIRVYRTQLNQVDVVPFRDYVKHVLPNEWIPTWKPDALKAGAMAVKMYAWYWVSLGGKQKALTADVKDNVEDQVYDPNVSYESSDAAVDATFDYVMTLNGALFPTQYCAGSYSEVGSGDCPWSSLYMTQWGSAYHADHGKSWGWILQYYYTGAVITPSPPGGGYNGTPVARIPATRVPQPSAPPPGGTYTIGQGSDRPDLFKDAYDRNGGAAVLGVALSPVRWWLTYVTEFNVNAQHFSGSDGRGNVWIVYDTLKAPSQGVHRAFVLTGDIAAAYAAHTPAGPEWAGAPTSDPYISGPDMGSVTSQGFTNGTLTVVPGGVQLSAWPQTFAGWKAEYFPGHDSTSVQSGPSFGLSGQPALVKDVASPSFDWAGSPTSSAVGAGKGDWSAQFTKDLTVSPGSYDFKIATDGGLRLWLDGLLAVDSWQARQGADLVTYNADLDGSPHRVRIQYYSTAGGGKLQFDLASHGQQAVAPPPAPPAATPVPQPPAPPAQKAPPAQQPTGQASVRIGVQWLGRGPAPSDRWALPLTLLLSAPGNPTIIGTYKATTDRNGVAFFNNLPAGIFDLHVKGTHSLQSARAAIGLQSGSTVALDMRTQLEGDVNGDNCVTPDDSIVGTGPAWHQFGLARFPGVGGPQRRRNGRHGRPEPDALGLRPLRRHLGGQRLSHYVKRFGAFSFPGPGPLHEPRFDGAHSQPGGRVVGSQCKAGRHL